MKRFVSPWSFLLPWWEGWRGHGMWAVTSHVVGFLYSLGAFALEVRGQREALAWRCWPAPAPSGCTCLCTLKSGFLLFLADIWETTSCSLVSSHETHQCTYLFCLFKNLLEKQKGQQPVGQVLGGHKVFLLVLYRKVVCFCFNEIKLSMHSFVLILSWLLDVLRTQGAVCSGFIFFDQECLVLPRSSRYSLTRGDNLVVVFASVSVLGSCSHYFLSQAFLKVAICYISIKAQQPKTSV